MQVHTSHSSLPACPAGLAASIAAVSGQSLAAAQGSALSQQRQPSPSRLPWCPAVRACGVLTLGILSLPGTLLGHSWSAKLQATEARAGTSVNQQTQEGGVPVIFGPVIQTFPGRQAEALWTEHSPGSAQQSTD